MSAWVFMDYVETSGNDPFADWLRIIPLDAVSHIHDRMLMMERLSGWPDKWASKYSAKESLWELRLPYNKVQYRPLYVPSPYVRGQLVILAGAIEKNGKIPRNVIDSALIRAKQLQKGPQHAVRHIY